MNELTHIILTVISNGIFWIGIGLCAILWPNFFFHETGLYETDLVKVLPRHKGINKQFYLYGFLWFMSTYLPIIAISFWFTRWFQFPIKHHGDIFVGFFLAHVAAYMGLFALIKGVYPTGRFLRYVYNDSARIRRIGKLQVCIALSAEAVAILALAIALFGAQ